MQRKLFLCGALQFFGSPDGGPSPGQAVVALIFSTVYLSCSSYCTPYLNPRIDLINTLLDLGVILFALAGLVIR